MYMPCTIDAIKQNHLTLTLKQARKLLGFLLLDMALPALILTIFWDDSAPPPARPPTHKKLHLYQLHILLHSVVASKNR